VSLTRGDRRRTALLEALDEHLRDAGPDARLDDINVADLSRRAGVTRSAFYFYFDNKAAAVAALMDEMEDEAWGAADLLGGQGDVAMRERTAAAIRTVFDGWGRRPHVFRAMLEARVTSGAARERWDAHIDSFVTVVTAIIESEREAGAAPGGPAADAIATALLDVNDRTLERLVRAPADFDWDRHVEAVVHLWLSAIYGSTS
jgi:TetR/AcrR family transcriptional regulator, ethionamide resistance regulator